MARLGYEAACAALRGGDRIMVTFPDPKKASERTSYSLLGGGTVSAPTWRKLVEHLRPSQDGLFADGASQTYEWAGDS